MLQEKSTLAPLHRLAFVLLALTAGWNLFGMVTKPRLGRLWTSQYEQFGFVIGLWTLVIWKMWTRPRTWGKWVGIVMVIMVPMHGFLWYRGMEYFRRVGQEMEFVPELLRFLPYELLFFVTGIVCLLAARQANPRETELPEAGK